MPELNNIKKDGCSACRETGSLSNSINMWSSVLFWRIAASLVPFILAFFPSVPDNLAKYMLLAGYVVCGYDVLFHALRNTFSGRFMDEFFLMSLATAGAILLGEYHEALGVMLFYQTGEFLQQTAVNRSRNNVKSLLLLRPDMARRIDQNGKTESVSPGQIKEGDSVAVYPGERVPVDGVLTDGSGSVDLRAITGESIPVELNPGMDIPGGAVSVNASLVICVTRSFAESTPSRILALVEEAAEKKPPTERFITRFSRVYTPIVVAAALCIAFLPPFFMEGEAFSKWIYRGLTFLVISCPCALVLSIPLGYFAGIGAGSRRGVLFKGGVHIDTLASARQVIFDKTGTLTSGDHEIDHVETEEGTDIREALALAAWLESRSSHPLARVFSAYENNVNNGEFSLYRETAGSGVEARTENAAYLVGSETFLALRGVKIPDEKKGKDRTTIHLAVSGMWIAAFYIGDTLRKGAREVIEELKSLGVEKTGLFSGDIPGAVERIGRQLGIDDIRSQLRPEEKYHAIETASPGPVVYIGDGINDAPALARADLGVAMGGIGSDSAVEAADVVLARDDLSALPEAIRIARKTRRIVRQNIAGVFTVKLVLLGLGATGIASIWMAVFGDVGVALLAVLNAGRILRPLAPQRLTVLPV